MEKLNNLYLSVEKWCDKQDPKLIQKLLNWASWYEITDFHRTLYWYQETKKMHSDVREYYLGNKEITLDIVKSHLANYCIKNEKDLVELATGEIDDEIKYDANNYMLSNSEAIIVAYLAYKLNWNKTDFENHLYNSLQYTEEIGEMFIDYKMPSDEEIEIIIKEHIQKKQLKDEKNFNYELKKIIEEFEDKTGFEDRINIIKQLLT
jgi:hypothetical protein